MQMQWNPIRILAFFIATGNVVFEQGRMTLKADRVEYHRDTGQAEASGSVVFTDHQGNIHFSDHMTMGKRVFGSFCRTYYQSNGRSVMDGGR